MSILLKQLLMRFSIISLIKIIGAFGRLPLFRLLGAEGIGLYQMTYSFYGLILTFIVGGFPTALSLAVAKNERIGIRLLKLSAVIMIGLGVIFYCFSFFFPSVISKVFGEDKLIPAIRFLAPAFLIVPILGLIRGFLQGKEYYGIIAVSELVEQVIRVFAMIVLSFLLIDSGLSYAVAGATFAAVAGGFASLLFLVVMLQRYSRELRIHQYSISRTSQPFGHVDTPMFLKMSIAILGVRLFGPITDFIDSILIPNRLMASGLTSHESLSIYGIFAGMASTIVYIPTMITAAISHILTVKITADWEALRIDHFQRRVSKALKLGVFWGITSSLFLFRYSEEISLAIMGDNSIGTAVRYLSIIPWVTGLRELSTSILWSINEKKVPLYGLIIGAILSFLISYFIIAIPEYRLIGVALGLLNLEIVASAWNLTVLYTKTKEPFQLFHMVLDTIFLLLFILLSIVVIQLIMPYFSLAYSYQLIVTSIFYFGLTSLYILFRTGLLIRMEFF
ncbi:oligosaccharide flippase family protein [Brevibacillus ginsengisoli]|uniref:oligosaccharide flippase family protein n=1 Tax=Brevibacillus ginsengisoli TaxID=363854 RepID=UPI003CE85D0C